MLLFKTDMKNRIVSLKSLVRLVDDPLLSKRYVNYLCGFSNEEHTYRHDEIKCILVLLNQLNLSNDEANGFIYSYTIPQLNKEFDLLKISTNKCINIELKTKNPGEANIQKQLVQNHYYLNMLNTEVYLFTFVLESKQLYCLNSNGELEKTDYHVLKNTLLNLVPSEIDLDCVFSPKNILVSPLNEPQRFKNKNYLLTENQRNIKETILKTINDSDYLFVGLHGSPGTGKTLLLYDIAFELAKTKKVLVLHCGIMCEGQNELNRLNNNLDISEVKILRLKDIKGYDVVCVDESHRIYPGQLERIIKWVPKANAKCIFSYDESQRLSYFENNSNTLTEIHKCCENNEFELKNKIRTNKEISYFIRCLRNTSNFKEPVCSENIRIVFEPDKKAAVNFAKESEKDGYVYISYTPSTIYCDLNYQKSNLNTHRVIGQEYDSVVMIINDSFYYKDNKLMAKEHPNPDYLYTQLLYQGLTRARTKLLLIIQTKDMLNKVLSFFEEKNEK